MKFASVQRTRPSHLISAAIALALASANGNVTHAQMADDASSETALNEVVVTGSRIVRRDYTSQSPIVTMNAENLEMRSSVSLETALNQLPQFTTAGTGQMNSSSGTLFASSTLTPGAATVNLRGLGSNRNLVLVDGRRVQPVNGSLVVDLNTIPAAAIESVEVITGGAAAVYGADAISGVINIKLKRNFQGMEFSGQYGITEHGDGETTQFSALIGANIEDGRGNVMLGANYADRGDILGKDRDWVRRGWDDPGTLSSQGGVGASNLAQFVSSPTNAPTLGWLGPSATYTIDQNGRVFNAQNAMDPAHPYTGPLGGDSGFKILRDGSLGYNDRENSHLALPLERYSLFGSMNYDLTERINFFTDLRYSETRTRAQSTVAALFNIWTVNVPYNPLYDDPDSPTFGQAPPGTALHPVPRELADLLNSRPDPNAPWTYGGGIDYFPNIEAVTTSNVFQIVSGLRGDLPWGDWTWEAYGSHGKSTVNSQQPEGFPNLQRMQNLFNHNQYGEGYQVTFPIAVTGSCTSGLPIFNPDGSVDNTPFTSQDCADYAVMRMNSITTLEQEVLEATTQGTLFNLPAGPLQMAFGVGYREENFRFDPDSGYNANQDYPNVVQNIVLPVSVRGKTSVKEVFTEFIVPVVSDLPFIRKFELEPGFRLSDYDTEGSQSTYKILANWEINDWVRLRGGLQHANRAANIAELFTPKGGSALASGTDACGNWVQTPDWGNSPANPNRLNVQILCQYLMMRDGAPAELYVPGTPSADNYNYNVTGGTTYFPFSLAVVEGNPELESEKADTITVGLVLRSPFEAPALRRMTLSIDYFNIDIEDAIGTPGHDVVYQQCLDARYNSLVGAAPGSVTGEQMAANNPFCALIEREYVAGTPNVWGADRKYNARYLNQGGIKSKGYDVQFDWATFFEDIGLSFIPGTFTANIVYSKLNEYSVSGFPGAPYIDYTGTTENASYDYRLFSTFGYSNGPFSAGLRWQHLPSLKPIPGSATTVYGVKSHDHFDWFGRWVVNERYELRGGIDNLFDTEPEVVGASATNNAFGSTSPEYDTFGRRFYLAFKASF